MSGAPEHFGALRPRGGGRRARSRRGEAQQAASGDEQIGERAGDEQAVGVLGDAAIAHFGEAEHALDHADRMLDLGARLRLGAVLGALWMRSMRSSGIGGRPSPRLG